MEVTTDVPHVKWLFMAILLIFILIVYALFSWERMEVTTDVPHVKWLFMAILLIFILIVYALFSWERSADLKKENYGLKDAKGSGDSQSYYPFPSEEGDSGPFHKLGKSISFPTEEGGGKNDLVEILENKKKMGYDDDDTALFIPFGQMIHTKIENRSLYAYDKKFDTAAAADNYRLNFQSFHTEGGSTIPKLHEGDLSHNTETKSLDMSTESWGSERPLDGRGQQLTVLKEDESWIDVFGNSNSNFSVTSENDEALRDTVYKNVRESSFDMTEAMDPPEGSGIAAQYDTKSLIDDTTELLAESQEVPGDVEIVNKDGESQKKDEDLFGEKSDIAPPVPMSLISVHSEVRQPGEEGTELDKSADGLIASSYELTHQDLVRDFPNPTTSLPFVFDLDVGKEEFVQTPNVTIINRQTSMLEIQVSKKNRVASLEIGFKLEKMEITEWDNITSVPTTMNEIVNNLFINQNGMEDVSVSFKLPIGESLWPTHADNLYVSSDKYVDATEVGVMVKQHNALTSKSFGNVAEILSATNEGVEFEEVNVWRKDDENKDVCTATDIEAENLLDPGAIMVGDIPDGSFADLERDKDTCLDYDIEPIGLGTKEQTQPVDLMTFEIQERDHAEKCLLNLAAFRPLQYVLCLVASHTYPPLLEMNMSAFRLCLLALRLCYAASHPYLPPNLTVMQSYTDCFSPNLNVMQTYTDCFPPNLTVIQTYTDCFPPNLTVIQTHTDCFLPNLTVMQTYTDCFPPNLTVIQTHTDCFPPNLTVIQTHTDCFPPNLTVIQTHTGCFPPNLTVMQTYTDCFSPNLNVMQTYTDCFPPNLTVIQTYTDCFPPNLTVMQTHTDCFPPNLTVIQTHTDCFLPNLTVIQTHTDCFLPNLTVMQTHTDCFPPNLTVIQTHTDCFLPNLTVMQTHTDCFPPNLTVMQTHTDCFPPNLTVMQTYTDCFPPSLNVMQTHTDCFPPNLTVMQTYTDCFPPNLTVMQIYTDCFPPNLNVIQTYTDCFPPNLTVIQTHTDCFPPNLTVMQTYTDCFPPNLTVIQTHTDCFPPNLTVMQIYTDCFPPNLTVMQTYTDCFPPNLTVMQTYTDCFPPKLTVMQTHTGCFPPNLTVMQTYTDCFPPNLTVMQTYTDCFPPNLTVMQTYTDCFPPNLTVMQTHTDCFPPNLTVMQTYTDCFPPNLTVMQTYTDCFPPSLNVIQTHTDCFPPNLTVMQTHTDCFPPNLTVIQTHTGCFPPNLTVIQTYTDCFPPNLTVMQTYTDCFPPNLTVIQTYTDCFPPNLTVMQTHTGCFPPNLTVMQTYTDCFPLNLTVIQTHTDCFPPNLTVIQTHTDCFPPNLTVMQTYTDCFPPILTVIQTYTDCFPPNLTVIQTHTDCFLPNLAVMQTHTGCFPPNLAVMQTHTGCFPPNLAVMQTHTDCFLCDIAVLKTCADLFPPGSTDSLVYRQDEPRPLEGSVKNVAGNNNGINLLIMCMLFFLALLWIDGGNSLQMLNYIFCMLPIAFILSHLMPDLGPVQILPVSNNSSRPCRVQARRGATCQQRRGQKKCQGHSDDNPDGHCMMDGPDHVISLDEERRAGRLTQHPAAYFKEKKNRKSALPLQPKCGNSDNDVKGAHARSSNTQAEDLKRRCLCITPRCINEREIVCLGCGHLDYCEPCFNSKQKSDPSVCPSGNCKAPYPEHQKVNLGDPN